MTVRAAEDNNDPPGIAGPTGSKFQITNRKLHVPVFTLSKENDKKLLEQLQSVFKITIKWNKYRSQMTIQPQDNNLNYLIDPTFIKVDRFLVFSFERIEENNVKKDHIDSFSQYYVPNVEIKYFNILIDRKSFFDFPVKKEEEVHQKTIDMIKNNDRTILLAILLDFAYFKENYRLIAIDLSKQTKLKDLQPISFIFEFLQNCVSILKK